MAMHSQSVPADFSSCVIAAEFSKSIMDFRKGWHAGKPDQVPMQACVACVELPE